VLLQLSLLFLPVAATCGWLLGRKDRVRSDSRGRVHWLRQDYFKGLNYLINEQPDKAVDVFVKLLEVDSDTVETHLALGSLFRRRGEVDRAIRIHQNLIARPQLAKRYRVQALSELGQDYLFAGVLDRAERLFLELFELGEENTSSLSYLLRIYQQEKDWEKAIATAKRLAVLSGESMHVGIAHYCCEMAEQKRVGGQINAARNYLKRAASIDPACARASLIRGNLECEAGDYKEAIRCYKRVKLQDPDFISEIAEPLVHCYQKMGEEKKLIAYLQECLKDYPRIAFVLVMSEYMKRHHGDKYAIEFLAEQIQGQPSLRGMSYLVDLYLSNSSGDAKDKLKLLQNYIQMLLADKPTYRCLHCGYAGNTLFWLCPSCHHWSSIKPIQGLEGN